jgi:hypothetical protein
VHRGVCEGGERGPAQQAVCRLSCPWLAGDRPSVTQAAPGRVQACAHVHLQPSEESGIHTHTHVHPGHATAAPAAVFVLCHTSTTGEALERERFQSEVVASFAAGRQFGAAKASFEATNRCGFVVLRVCLAGGVVSGARFCRRRIKMCCFL